MKHLGDIKNIHGGKITPVDVITFGSPCQDLSIAGKQEGLAGERSGLFMEAIRVIKEMWEATNGTCPTYVIWENVPGAFSTPRGDKGEDFRLVLKELIRIRAPGADVPRPPDGIWKPAGAAMGDGWSLAWRIFDAQFWGVAQRRRRIALVMGFRGQSAPKILFEREGVRGDSAPGTETGQRTAGCLERGVDTAIPILEAGKRTGKSTRDAKYGIGIGEAGDPMYTLQARAQHAIAFMAGQSAESRSLAVGWEKAPTLKAANSGLNQVPSICEPEIARTLTAQHDSSACPDRGQNILASADNAVTGSLTSRCGNPSPMSAQTGNIVTVRMAHGQANAEITEEVSPTLNCNHEQPIIKTRYRVRRLTPLECERLQGYPDGWADIPEYLDSTGHRRKVSDAARYKALGNSIALPPWFWVLGRVSDRLGKDSALGSLFDGIGGFPLIWETLQGKGSTKWASEIEAFPIAVTKFHFGGE